MAYSKNDFIDFSALDLDELLGEYTNSEIELSDDDSDDSVFNPSQKKFQFFSHLYFVVYKCFQFGPV